MAPPSGAGKRVKGVQIYRPFVYGTTARPFSDKNPKPAGVPDDHTHSWTVFVKGVDDTDVSYWLRRVQFKLHESIPNHLRTVDSPGPGKPFEVHETGWGEFEITIKLYYVAESAEKAQTLYHHLRLHPYGRTDAEKEAMRANGEVPAWTYDEQLFNEPYEIFYEVLTSGALPPANPAPAGKGKGKAAQVQPKRSAGGVLERSAMIPLQTRPGQPFSRETEEMEVQQLKDVMGTVAEMQEKLKQEVQEKEKKLAALKAEAAAAAAGAGAPMAT